MQTLSAEISRAADLKAAEDYCFMESQKIKKSLAPAQFELFKKACETECENIGKISPVELHFEEESTREFSVRNLRSGRMVSFAYDPDVPCIHFESPKGHGHIAFHLSSDGTMLQFVLSGIPKFIRELIHRFFSMLTK